MCALTGLVTDKGYRVLLIIKGIRETSSLVLKRVGFAGLKTINFLVLNASSNDSQYTTGTDLLTKKVPFL